LALKNKNNPLLTAGKKFRDIKRKGPAGYQFLDARICKRTSMTEG
jgi:hypothetical protein